MKVKWIAAGLWLLFAGIPITISPSFAQISTDGKEVTSGPFKGTKITGTRIDIKYTPDNKVSPCDKIVFIQVVKRTGTKADGTTVPLKPSDYKNFPGAAVKDKDTIPSEGKTVDYSVNEKDPYYNGDDSQDIGTQGKTNPTPATMNDTPNAPDASFPENIVKDTMEFETAAFCADGKDAGFVFGTIKWKYEKEKGGNATTSITSVSTVTGPPKDAVDIILPDGTIFGTFPIYSSNAPGQPSDNFWDGTRLWLANHKFTLPGITAPPPQPPPPSNVAMVIPSSTVDRATVAVSIPTSIPEDPTLADRGIYLSGFGRGIEAFDLNGDPYGFYPFGASVTIAFNYSDENIAGLDERTLGVGLFDPVEGVYSAEGISVISNDPWANTITFMADSLGLFAIIGFCFCDIDRDIDVDRNDIEAIFSARNTEVPANDPRDVDGDGIITVNDARICVLECTNSRCTP